MATTIKKTFPVTGLHCASCAMRVETNLKSQQGVVFASVNFANSDAYLEYQPDTNPDVLKSAIQSLGYDLLIDEAEGKNQQEEIQHQLFKELKQKTVGAAILAIPVAVISMFFMDLPYVNWIMWILSTPVVIWFGRSFFITAFKQAKQWQTNMDTLVALSTGAAYLFSVFNTVYPQFWHAKGIHPHVYFEASSVVIAFIMLGKLLEEKAKSNTSSAIKKLMGLQSKTVTLFLENGEEMVVPISSVKVGDRLLVKPGERVPVDGIVYAGTSFVDESTITGEPVPNEKMTGSMVFAGTINQKGSFQFTAQKVGGETVLARIIQLVQEAQGSKAPVQKLVDKIAGIFVPIVILIAIATFLVWWIIGGENALPHAFMAMVTVLVIACPCAMGLATPTAIMVGIGKGAENGILIKDAESLELSHKINAIVLDKTGTITEGKPEVTSIDWQIPDVEQTELKSVLLAMESRSEHPLAEAVCRVLKSEDLVPAEVDSFQSITGKGIIANKSGISYKVGSILFLHEQKIIISEEVAQKILKWENEAKTVISFTRNDQLIAIIGIEDRIKENSLKAVQTMQSMGIEIYMLTGDSSATAKAVAQKTGIINYSAEVLPDDKGIFVSKLQKAGKIVAMVGDGINDSQALAQADVSIAMGKGSDIAMDVAKITLISSDLQLIPKAILLSGYTVKTIRQNLFWAFIYNIIAIPVAAGVLFPIWGFLLNPMIAGAAMAMSSVSVVSNSLLLKRKKISQD
jgi:P-type Cu2+ transporter